MYTEHHSKSGQGLCEPVLLNCSCRRLTAFWAGSQVTHWVPVQPVWASVSSSAQRQGWTLILRCLPALTRHSQTFLCGTAGSALGKEPERKATPRSAPRTRVRGWPGPRQGLSQQAPWRNGCRDSGVRWRRGAGCVCQRSAVGGGGVAGGMR